MKLLMEASSSFTFIDIGCCAYKESHNKWKVASGYSTFLKYLFFILGVLQKLIMDYLTKFKAQKFIQALWESVSQSVFCGTSTYCVLNTVPPLEDDHGNSNSSHVKIFLPKKLLECLPKCSSLPKERHRWNTNEVSALLLLRSEAVNLFIWVVPASFTKSHCPGQEPGGDAGAAARRVYFKRRAF
uniref:Calmodulin binding transcription activator 1 n=1 Tax=Capra hircus TaxID=9925 RepID=A0A8C2RSJ5_CAPHI